MSFIKIVCIGLVSVFVAVFNTGCFFFGSKSVFDKANYEVVKLEIDNKVLLSPQELANQAKAQMGNSSSVNANKKLDSMLSYEDIGRNSNNDLNIAFEQLKLRNIQDDEIEDENQSTPLHELAKITLKSTFSIDKAQNMLYGVMGCNNYTAKFFWQDATKIVVSGSASTRKLCYPKELADLQNTFIRNFDGIYTVTKLRNRKGYVLNNGRMRIYLK